MSSKPLRPVGGQPDGFAVVVSLAEHAQLEDLPELVGQLARAQALAGLRIASGRAPVRTAIEEVLLTVEEVAAKLRISEANVYARAKTDLRAAVVEIGVGQLRFDRKCLARFIDARRRG